MCVIFTETPTIYIHLPFGFLSNASKRVQFTNLNAKVRNKNMVVVVVVGFVAHSAAQQSHLNARKFSVLCLVSNVPRVLCHSCYSLFFANTYVQFMHTHNKNIKYEKRTTQSASSFIIIILCSTLSIRTFGCDKRQGTARHIHNSQTFI